MDVIAEESPQSSQFKAAGCPYDLQRDVRVLELHADALQGQLKALSSANFVRRILWSRSVSSFEHTASMIGIGSVPRA